MQIQANVPLAPLTTMHVGGSAKYFVECETKADIKEALAFARDKNLPIHILGGGSNTLFADAGFAGVVLKIALRGIEFKDRGEDVLVTAAAGEPWDGFVDSVVERGLIGVECLSGIPGTVGATPVQNVGAYGQSVGDTIESLEVLDLASGEMKHFTAAACEFTYRASRFKKADVGKYLITQVTFQLTKKGEPQAAYPDLIAYIKTSAPDWEQRNITEKLQLLRQAVLSVRTRKSMVYNDPAGSYRSCGSFFTNIMLSPEQFQKIAAIYAQNGGIEPIPMHTATDGALKISAAWLIEQAGFHKGMRRGPVGLSGEHVLAVVNYGDATTREILDFATEIQTAVKNKFGIELEREPVVVQ